MTIDSKLATSALLFSEEPSRVVVSCPPAKAAALRRVALKHQAPLLRLGTVGGDRLEIGGIASVALAAMREAYEHTIPEIAGER